MKPENLETAARFAQKRRELKEIYDLLFNHTSNASVTVTVPISVNKQKHKAKAKAQKQSRRKNRKH